MLVVVSPGEVHVYSGLALPPREGEDFDRGGRLVTQLNRVADTAEVRSLVLAVESGEFFRRYSRSFDPERRVDRELLRNLEATRERLAEVSGRKTDPQMLEALLCRVVFTCYLCDRGVIGPSYFEPLGRPGAAGLRDLLSRPAAEAKDLLYNGLFQRLGADFNGDLFSDDLGEESQHITPKHLETLRRFVSGADVRTGQGSFWPYDFSLIPIETISAIYEHFLQADSQAKKRAGAFYTPRFLAEIVLDLTLRDFDTLLDKRYLDPSCGSGIFLVGVFNRMAEEWHRRNPGASYSKQAVSVRRTAWEVDEEPHRYSEAYAARLR